MIWILGGCEVYRESLALADEFWATHIHAVAWRIPEPHEVLRLVRDGSEDCEGDVRFPDGWQEHFQTEVPGEMFMLNRMFSLSSVIKINHVYLQQHILYTAAERQPGFLQRTFDPQR